MIFIFKRPYPRPECTIFEQLVNEIKLLIPSVAYCAEGSSSTDQNLLLGSAKAKGLYFGIAKAPRQSRWGEGMVPFPSAKKRVASFPSGGHSYLSQDVPSD